MNGRKRKQETGSVEVEATFIFPIMILCIILLLYLSSVYRFLDFARDDR